MSEADTALSVFAVLVAIATIAFAWWRKVPIVMGIAIANFAVFVLTMVTGRGFSVIGSPIVQDLAARVSYLSADGWPRLYTIFTATFLHAGPVHLVGNMLVLLLIGVPFEERVRRGRFLVIYFWSAIVAVLLHALYIYMRGGDRSIPLVGASGAVFGILGAFATMYPKDRVYTVIPPFIIPLRLPVVVTAIILMALEYLAIAVGTADGVAHAAHFGGAVGGVIMGLLFRTSRAASPEAVLAPRVLRYDVLERLATSPQQRAWIQKLRENEDHVDAQRAWLERLLPSLRCPQHGTVFQARGRSRLACPDGHEERYAD